MKRLILIVIIYSLAITSLLASKDGETRTATVTMKVAPNDLINVKAKNTDLTIEAWNRDEVQITASIRFEGKMTEKMEKFLNEFQEKVEENIRMSGNELLIDTNLDEPNKVQVGSKKVGIIIGFSEDELKLDYRIKAPATNPYEVASSYKDIRLQGNFREMDITQYSGDIVGDNLEEAKLNLKYGSASFKKMNKAEMEIYEQEVEIEAISTLDLNAKYSELEITEAGEVEAQSYESDYVMGSVEDISGNFKYGKIEIEQKLEKAELSLYEMDIESRNIDNIRLINSRYSQIEAGTVGSIIFDQSYEDETEFGKLGSFKSLQSRYGNHKIELLTGSIELNAYEDDIRIEEISSDATQITIDGKYINASIGVTEVAYSLIGNIKYGKVQYDEDYVSMRKYIKESDKLEVELQSKKTSDNPLRIKVNGYEVDVKLD